MPKSIVTSDYKLLLAELRRTREGAGVTQQELAIRLGQSQSFVSKCERGERRLDVLELRNYCRALGLPLSNFIRRLERILK